MTITTRIKMTTTTIKPVLAPPPPVDCVGPVVDGVPETHVFRVPMVTHDPHRLPSLGPKHPEFEGHEEWQVAVSKESQDLVHE